MNKSRGQPCSWTLCLKMTDEDVVKHFGEVFEGRVDGPLRYKSMKDHHKSVWTWSRYGRNCVPILIEMIPYLGLRRSAKAAELLQWYDERKRKVGKGEGGVGGVGKNEKLLLLDGVQGIRS